MTALISIILACVIGAWIIDNRYKAEQIKRIRVEKSKLQRIADILRKNVQP